MGLIYCIQEHHAKRLHWDIRLEMNNVLKSWAMPKRPSNELKVKRLLIQTEDHSIDYADFEGEIPKGEYGAGLVKLYDKGSYEMIESKNDNKFLIRIFGKKLYGVFVVLKLKNKNEWLIFKKGD